MTPPRSTRKKIPRDCENDYTPEAAEARRAFLREQTGVGLEHVSHYSSIGLVHAGCRDLATTSAISSARIGGNADW
jgi:hypothetical protein